jgi:hypothetical protein
MILAALSPKRIRESKMDLRTSYPVLLTLSLASGIAGSANAAEERIGVAAVVRNLVSQLEPQVTRISKGDEVVRNEVVRTATDSDARLVFRDDTNLLLGPGSTLRLDRTVFDDPKAGDIAIKLTSGTFRIVTGNSNKEAYEIKTPIATLGVRGTILDVRVMRRQNTVVLRTGAVTVCVPGSGKCVDLLHEGDSANITSNGRDVNIDIQTGSTWTFDGNCNGGLCGTSTFAQAGGDNITTGSLGSGAGGGGAPTSPGSFPSGGGGGGGGGGSTGQGGGSGGGSSGGGGGGVGGGGGGGGGTLTGGTGNSGVTLSTSP